MASTQKHKQKKIDAKIQRCIRGIERSIENSNCYECGGVLIDPKDYESIDREDMEWFIELVRQKLE